MNQRLRRSPPDLVYTPIDVTSMSGATPPKEEQSGVAAFTNLLTVLDVEPLLITPSRLGSQLIDYKDGAEQVDPAQVENMDSWYGLVIDATGGGPGMTFGVVDFVSQSAAQEHYATVMAGMVSMTTPIGDTSAEIEVNAQGIGSILVFIKGDRVVMLHTAQPEGEASWYPWRDWKSWPDWS